MTTTTEKSSRKTKKTYIQPSYTDEEVIVPEIQPLNLKSNKEYYDKEFYDAEVPKGIISRIC